LPDRIAHPGNNFRWNVEWLCGVSRQPREFFAASDASEQRAGELHSPSLRQAVVLANAQSIRSPLEHDRLGLNRLGIPKSGMF
jgi:hypothetical protein